MIWKVERVARAYHLDPVLILRTWTWRDVDLRNRLLDAIEDAEIEAAANRS